MIVLEIVFLLVFWVWAVIAFILLRNTFLSPTPITETPDHLGLSAETVWFPATDGVRLEGWKISGDPANLWLILCHRLSANRSELLKLAAGLRSAGFNILLFDFRGHGGSAGRITSFGSTERRDLQGAVAYLGQQPEIPPHPYGVYGASMGAAVALLVAAGDDRVGAVAAEGAYSNLSDTFARHLRLMHGFFGGPILWMLCAIYRLRFGLWPSAVSPVAAISLLAPRSVLLIQGTMDTRTPLDSTKRLHAAAGEPCELWIIRGAGHHDAFVSDPDTYAEKLTQFFQRALAP